MYGYPAWERRMNGVAENMELYEQEMVKYRADVQKQYPITAPRQVNNTPSENDILETGPSWNTRLYDKRINTGYRNLPIIVGSALHKAMVPTSVAHQVGDLSTRL